MAIATYTTDLQTFHLLDTSATNSEFTGYTATNKSVSPDTDYPIQGTGHISAEQRTANTGSIAVDYGSNITWTSGWNIFLWGVFLAGSAMDTDANGGIVMMIGSSTSDFYKWTVGGKDFGRNPYGGWQNWVADPEVTTGRTTTGAPGTNYRWAGFGCSILNAISKGSPYGCDAIRFGRGDLRVIDGQSGAYGTFIDMSIANDDINAKWGLFQENAGSYLWKGLISLGTTTAVDFRDSNRVISIDNTRRVQSGFNRIEINHASSNIEWTSINISALGTTSKGELEVIDDATVSFDTCVFTDMSTFIFLSNSTLANVTWRRCELVTQGGGTFTDCVFEDATSSASMLSDDIDLITSCTFESDGSNHAIELTSAHAAGTFSCVDNVFTGYETYNSSGTATGNEAIYNNSGGAVTINVSGGALPSFRNGTGASTIVQASYTLTLTDIASGVQVTIVNNSTRTELQNTISTGADITYAHQGGETVDILLMDLDYDPNLSDIFDLTLPSAHSSIKFQLIDDPNYNNPA